MALVPAEDRRQVETDINGRRYRARDGFFEMPDRDAAIHRKSANLPAWQAFRGAYGRSNGYRCTGCGFGSFFTKCSRCGSECVREGCDAPASAQDSAA